MFASGCSERMRRKMIGVITLDGTGRVVRTYDDDVFLASRKLLKLWSADWVIE